MVSEVDDVVKILLVGNLNQNHCCSSDAWEKKIFPKI